MTEVSLILSIVALCVSTLGLGLVIGKQKGIDLGIEMAKEACDNKLERARENGWTDGYIERGLHENRVVEK